MSFSSDLWKGFDTLRNHFRFQHEELQHIYFIFQELSSLEMEYSKGLEYLFTISQRQLRFGTLGKALTTFTDNINKLSIYHRDQSTFISEKIMIPLNEVISSHMNSITRAFINNDNNEREFNKILNELVLKQENFHTAAKDLSVAIADNEIAKVNANIKKSMKNKYMTMQNKKMDVAKNKEMEYILYLSEANKEREKFNEKTKSIHDELQNLDKNLIEIMKWAMMNYTTNNSKGLDGIIKDHEQLTMTFNNIDSYKDIKEFIQKNATKAFPFYKFEFVPYKGTNIKNVLNQNLKNESNNVDKTNIVTTVKSFISKELKYIAPKFDENTNAIFKEIEEITDLIWKDSLVEIKRKKLVAFLDEKININYFIKCLNTHRAHGDFIMAPKAFDTLVDIFNNILDKKKYQSDYNILKNIIIMSQTFYKIENNDENSKRLVQLGIQSHFVWHTKETWEEIIKYSIGEQDRTNKDNLLFSHEKENDKERTRRLQQFAKNNLVLYLCNMSLFKIKSELSQEVKEFFCEVYDLDDKEITESVREAASQMNEEKEDLKDNGGIGGNYVDKLQTVKVEEEKKENA